MSLRTVLPLWGCRRNGICRSREGKRGLCCAVCADLARFMELLELGMRGGRAWGNGKSPWRAGGVCTVPGPKSKLMELPRAPPVRGEEAVLSKLLLSRAFSTWSIRSWDAFCSEPSLSASACNKEHLCGEPGDRGLSEFLSSAPSRQKDAQDAPALLGRAPLLPAGHLLKHHRLSREPASCCCPQVITRSQYP